MVKSFNEIINFEENLKSINIYDHLHVQYFLISNNLLEMISHSLNEYRADLLEFQLNRLNSFKNKDLQYQYLVRSKFLNIQLNSNSLQVQKTEADFEYNQYLKPRLNKIFTFDERFEFNLSHSSDHEKSIYLFAKHNEYSIGVDIELNPCSQTHIDFISKQFLLMKNNNDEAVDVNANNISKLWSVIESLGKCIGSGLSTNFSEYQLNKVEADQFAFTHKLSASNFTVHTVWLACVNQYASICIQVE